MTYTRKERRARTDTVYLGWGLKTTVKRLIGGLAAAQLFCTDSKECYRFVASGGMALLMESSLDLILEESARTDTRSSDEEDDSKVLGRALAASKLLLELLNSKGTVEKGTAARFSRWLMLDAEDVGNLLPSHAAYGATATITPVNSRQDIDPFLLSVLQERRLLPLLAALFSAPRFRLSQGYAKNLCVEFVGVIEVLLLGLLNCRSGVLSLTSDNEAAVALLDSFQRMQEVHEKDLPPLRHSLALTAAGFLCKPQDIAAMLQTCFSVMSSMDRLLASSSRSDEPLWALRQLCKISREAIGKQAVLMMTWFPEVIQSLVGALSAPDSDMVLGETWKRLAACWSLIQRLQVSPHGYLMLRLCVEPSRFNLINITAGVDRLIQMVAGLALHPATKATFNVFQQLSFRGRELVH